MAQLIVTAAAGLAGAVGKIGVGSILARTVAVTAASFAASAATNAILGPRRRSVEGPRLEAFQVQSSTEGAGVLRVWGRARVAGQIIWAARFRETASTTSESAGGKGGPSSRTTITEYAYSISFAVGLCEGPIDRVGRVWADGRPLDLSKINMRIYHGDETQGSDDLIAAIEGAAPGFRGLAYVVFEDLPLADFGNRIPQLSFEVERSLGRDDPGALENALTAVTVIPSSGEFVYGTTPVRRIEGEGVAVVENRHAGGGETDFAVSMDALQSAAPNLAAASLVVSWFGDDLNAGDCELRPGVESAAKTTEPYEWRAGGVGRAAAHVVSTLDGAPAYGGTPADRAVAEAIADMNARGLDVMFHPFILMDVPPGNELADPYGGASQAAFPWRGRIASAADATAGAAADVAAFFGAAAPADFSIVDGEVAYAGPAEWSFRRFILHYAHLCAAAGGVEAFIIGSELRGLTTLRDEAGGYPAVAALRALAADVRAALGPATKISYGADWSEYFGHQSTDGSGDVFFHLDPFWADANVDFVGIDNYLPLADWRDGEGHADALAGFAGPTDLAYLGANIAGGERFDWHYASDADRAAQVRTPIIDGAHGEDWVFRPKDLGGWWSNAHHDRPGGVRSATPTAWVPEGKPIRFTEIGCPAVDKGANQPNVFYDPKSAESAFPHFSSGARDDLAQRRFLEAHLAHWSAAANNPISSVYEGSMVAADRLYAYAWDARPYPFFPALPDVWGDHANWARGHWLNGRLGAAPLGRLVEALAAEAGAVAVDASGLEGTLAGYALDRPMSPRASLEPLAAIYQFDMLDAGGALRFRARAGAATIAWPADDLVVDGRDPALSVAREHRTDAPAALRFGFIDEGADYLPGVVEAVEPGRADARAAGIDAPVVIDAGEAAARARAMLAEAHVSLETATFRLPPSAARLEPGDAIELAPPGSGAPRRYRIAEISDGLDRRVEAVRIARDAYRAPADIATPSAPPRPPAFGPPAVACFDAPLLRDDDDPAAIRAAAFASPWPGRIAVYRRRAGDAGDGALAGIVEARGAFGRLDAALAPFDGPSGLWLQASFRIRLFHGSLASRPAEETLAGANAMLVEVDAATGACEVVQFRDATLGVDGVWTLSTLLRGQAGTEDLAALGAAAGARVALVDAGLSEIAIPLDALGLELVLAAGPAGEAPATSDAYAETTLTPAMRALAPLSPVHLKAERAAGGWSVSWIRRTRIGGDGWTTADAPLGEAYERYEVEIVAGGAVLRRETLAAPVFAYDAAKAAADFGPGGPAAPFEVRVAQVSDLVGSGVAAGLTIAP
ncbi:MAG: hypothetical protein GC152_03500 [Alphaproteobacteria bacterium]|nr:hypothetical protein [Alphaproteobacteria bacterium]